MNDSEYNHLHRWNDKDCVELFSDKTAQEYFKSETHFLNRIMSDVHSFLDIGCASGRLLELLKSFNNSISYVGVDISRNNITNARLNYPEYEFFLEDALNFTSKQHFNLVNATGVCQHEPRFEDLISRMIGLSDRYVLFDVKLADIDEHLIDIKQAYCGKENRLYFNILSLPRLLDFLKSLNKINSVSVFGYITQKNSRTVIPESIGELTSAGILLDISDSENCDMEIIELDIPDYLGRPR